jgi:hypothetical protein
LDLVLEHWSFAAAFVVFYAVGQTLKKGPLSASRASEVSFVRFVRRWLPLPLHPILAGVLLGFVPGLPVSVDTQGEHLAPSLYYGAAGALSVVWRNVFREWQKFKKESE